MKKTDILAGIIILAAAGAWAGGNKDASKTASQPAGVIKVRAAHTQTYVPYDFVNKDGQSDGYEVAVLKEVDRLLPQYEFQYFPTSDDDLLIGIESGKYDVGTKGVWITPERQKKYIFPRNPVGASIIGITFRTENADKIHDLESFAQFSGKLVPIAPQNAQWAVVQDFNTKHPAAQIKLLPSESFSVADAYTWVLEGRYDAFFDIKLSFQNNVLKDGAPYAKYKDKLSYVPYKGIPTWPLFNKKNQVLADAYDGAIATLKANGTLTALSQKYFGEDVFKFVTE